jgi:hypothetical protein
MLAFDTTIAAFGFRMWDLLTELGCGITVYRTMSMFDFIPVILLKLVSAASL